jgi:hypothetical protein
LIHSINHAFTRVGGKLKDPRVHAYRVFRACFDAKSAKNADTYVYIETPGHFFDIGIRILHRDYMDAVRGAYRFAHHACNAPGGAILSPGQSMTGPQSFRKRPAFFGIFDCDRLAFADLHPKTARNMAGKINKKVSRGQG